MRRAPSLPGPRGRPTRPAPHRGRSRRPPYQFVLALSVAKRPSASSSKQVVRIATGLPMQPIVEVMLVITRK